MSKKFFITIEVILITLIGGGAFALFLSDPPPPPPTTIETHGYYYWEQDQGFYTTPGGQSLEITNLTFTQDPQYGIVIHGDLYNGIGFKQGIIWWNNGGVRDLGLVLLNDGSGEELEVIKLPFGSPRNHAFVSPFN